MTRPLVTRLRHLLTDGGDQPRLCILLGAGATIPLVPGVAELTERAKKFADESEDPAGPLSGTQPVQTEAVQADRIRQYAEALELVKRARGVAGVRTLVQQAVLQPYDGRRPPGFPKRPLSDKEFGKIDEDTLNWRLPPGLQALASIIRIYGDQICPHLLTTNFDVLLQVALREAGVKVMTFAAHNDIPPAGLRVGPGEHAVIHLHGDCRGPTLHSPVDIRRNRPALESWLSHHLRHKTLLVVGYSGWDDIIGRILRTELNEAAADDADAAVDVLWAVYEDENQHSHINPSLAELFLENSQRVIPYYGIDRDRLFGELAEAVLPQAAKRGKPAPPRPSTFYDQARELTDYGFGHSHVSRTTNPKLIFWPHRLREPHLIHGVHALAAVLFSRLGIPVELHLDDVGLPTKNADAWYIQFEEAIGEWCAACGVTQPPSIHRISTLLAAMNEENSAARLWKLATDFYTKNRSVFETLAGAKVIDAEVNNVSILPLSADRVLRPLYTWLALEDALDRHDFGKLEEAPVVTLGGRDEQGMWDLWRARGGAPSVGSVYVPHLNTPVERTNLWSYPQLQRDAPSRAHDLTTLLRRPQADPHDSETLLEWVYTVAVRLASRASDNAVRLTFRGRSIETWSSMQAALRSDPMEATRSMAQAVSLWFHADSAEPGGRA